MPRVYNPSTLEMGAVVAIHRVSGQPEPHESLSQNNNNNSNNNKKNKESFVLFNGGSYCVTLTGLELTM